MVYDHPDHTYHEAEADDYCTPLSPSAFAFSKLRIETLEQGVKYVQS